MTQVGFLHGIIWKAVVVVFLLSAACLEAIAETRSLTDRDNAGWQDVVLDRVKREADLSVPIGDPRLLETLRFAVYDCWKPKRETGNLQSGVSRQYSESCRQIEPRRSEIAWLLVRYEWDAYRHSVERVKQEEAAWSLREAIAEYRRVARESAEPLVQKLNRLRVALGYSMAAEERLSQGGTAGIAESESALRKAVREELNAVLALDKFGVDPMKSISGPIVAMIKDVMATYIRAVDAEAVAKSLVVTVYGAGAALDASGEALSPSERETLDPAKISDDDLRTWIVQVTRARSAVGIVQRYAELKKNLWGQTAMNIQAGDLTIRTKDKRLNLLDAEDSMGECERRHSEIAQRIGNEGLAKSAPSPLCDRRADLRRALGPTEFDQLFRQHTREQQVQHLLFQVKEVACRPVASPFAGRTCDLLQKVLSIANSDPPDLKKSIDDLAIVSHLPYFADADPLPSEKEGRKEKMLYGRLAEALAEDNVTAKSSILDDRIDGLERAFARQRVINGVTLELGPADHVAGLEKDVQFVCEVVAAIDESLIRSGMRRLAIPACDRAGASR